jgi:hypothetical protein
LKSSNNTQLGNKTPNKIRAKNHEIKATTPASLNQRFNTGWWSYLSQEIAPSNFSISRSYFSAFMYL